MTIAILALALSSVFLAAIVVVLVLLRRGDGPAYGTTRLYDANRREAIRLLTGTQVEAAPGAQWYLRGAEGDAGLAADFRAAALDALRAAVPRDRNLTVAEGSARIPAGDGRGAEIVPALTTEEFRAARPREAAPREELLVALVLLNPEPPGGDAARLALPIQILFPALERAGRGDLVRRFSELRDRAAAPRHALTAEAP